MTANVSTRKPHSGNAGFVCELKCKLGGHVAIYDRDAAGVGIEADYRWIVMHEPSSLHVAIRSQADARHIMKGVAKAATLDEAAGFADILPEPGDPIVLEAPAIEQPAAAADRQAALERFLADPENETSAEGKASLRIAFGLDRRSRG